MSDMWVKRIGHVLFAADDISQNAIDALPDGQVLKADVRLTRNAGRHRLFWAMVQRIAEATDNDPSAVADLLKIDAGHCFTIRSRKHGTMYLPKTIKWSRMDETEFAPFFERCVKTIYEEWGISRPEIMDAIGDLLEPQTEKR